MTSSSPRHIFVTWGRTSHASHLPSNLESTGLEAHALFRRVSRSAAEKSRELRSVFLGKRCTDNFEIILYLPFDLGFFYALLDRLQDFDQIRHRREKEPYESQIHLLGFCALKFEKNFR